MLMVYIWIFIVVLSLCLYLPDLVRTIIALAQHLKDASTAPMATDSQGSRVRCVVRRSSSNTCLWNMAPSASRAIWTQTPKQVRERGEISTISQRKPSHSQEEHTNSGLYKTGPTTNPGIEPWILLLWGNSTNHCATIPPPECRLTNGNLQQFYYVKYAKLRVLVKFKYEKVVSNNQKPLRACQTVSNVVGQFVKSMHIYIHVSPPQQDFRNQKLMCKSLRPSVDMLHYYQ